LLKRQLTRQGIGWFRRAIGEKMGKSRQFFKVVRIGLGMFWG